MKVRIEPARLRLRETEPRLVHDVGELVVVPRASGRFELIIYAEDILSGAPVNGLAHVGPVTAATNRAFPLEFVAEFDKNTQCWSRQPAWVEAPGYEPADLYYELEVEAT